MKKFEYVLSGISGTKILNDVRSEPWFDEFVDTAAAITNNAKSRLAKSNTSTTGSISILYNGHTEKNFGEKFRAQKDIGCDSIYADSGGLQMITLGKTITPELKQAVYKWQSFADYGFCFDTIPLEKTATIKASAERTSLGNKLFRESSIEATATQTGKDICEQLSYFEKNNAKTKGIVIVQGNTWQDMVKWFDFVLKQIPQSLRHRIQGIAVADTCMGNGELETIEMMIATRKIAEVHGAQYTNHIHLLGVGSIIRLRPTMLLIRSGYLDCVDRVSYDSTSHSSNVYMGKFLTDGSLKSVPAHRTRFSVDVFSRIYNRNLDLYGNHFTLEEFLHVVFGDINKWTASAIIKNATDKHTDSQKALMFSIPWAFVVHQVEDFITNLDIDYGKEIIRGNSINELYYVKSDEDMDRWLGLHSRRVDSNRIARFGQTQSMEEFFI